MPKGVSREDILHFIVELRYSVDGRPGTLYAGGNCGFPQKYKLDEGQRRWPTRKWIPVARRALSSKGYDPNFSRWCHVQDRTVSEKLVPSPSSAILSSRFPVISHQDHEIQFRVFVSSRPVSPRKSFSAYKKIFPPPIPVPYLASYFSLPSSYY